MLKFFSIFAAIYNMGGSQMLIKNCLAISKDSERSEMRNLKNTV